MPELMANKGSQKIRIQPAEDCAMKGQLKMLQAKTSSLASSAITFNTLSRSSASISNAQVNCAPKMAIKQQDSTSFFSKTISSVTNFFAGSQPLAILERPGQAYHGKFAMKSPASTVSTMQRNARRKEELQELNKKREKKILQCQKKPIIQDTKFDQDQCEEQCANIQMECDIQSLKMQDEAQICMEKSKKKKKRNSSMEKSQKQADSKPSIIQKNQSITIEGVIKQQNVDGSFVLENLLKQLFPEDFITILAEGENKKISAAVIISYAVAKWIEKYHPEKQYALIIKKAYSFIKKTHKLQELQFLDVLLHKKEEIID